MLRRFTTSLRTINPLHLFLELVIVFIGVYLAFLLSNYQAETGVMKDRERVLTLLNLGVEHYQRVFGEFVLGHESYNQTFREQLQQQQIPNFGDMYYPAPQYPIDVITFILTDESFDLFEVGLYLPLTEYVNAIKRLMYIEEKLVQLSEEYEPLPSESHPDYPHLFAIQQQKATRFLQYLEKRKRTCEELRDRSIELGKILGLSTPNPSN